MRKELASFQQYIESYYPPESPQMQQARLDAEALGLEGISISVHEAQLIEFILSQINPRKILEIGTLTGLSALYFAKLIKSNNGQIWSLEKSEQHFKLASKNLLSILPESQCHLILGDAREKLPELEKEGPFDAIFIDGNKAAYLDYWTWAQKHVSYRGIIAIDNVFLSGSVWGDKTLQKFSEKQIAIMKTMTIDIFKNENFKSIFVPTTEGLIFSQKLS